MLKAYFKNVRGLWVSLVLCLPLLVLYQLGLLIVGWKALNGADFMTVELLQAIGRTGYIALNVGVLAAFGLGVYFMKRKNKLDPKYFGPLLGESLAYALVMGTAILFVMEKTSLLGPSQYGQLGVFERIVISAGAGLHEELVFRLGMITGIAALWRFLPVIGGKASAMAAAVIISSVLFSLAHFMAEPFAWFPFWYRTLAGLVFAGLFAFRGLAVAAYTHFTYDVYVLLLA